MPLLLQNGDWLSLPLKDSYKVMARISLKRDSIAVGCCVLLLVWVLQVCCVSTATVSGPDIVSIVDERSALACIIKIHSIVESSENASAINFRFLVMPGGNMTLQGWNQAITSCFPTIRMESVMWNNERLKPFLSGEQFDREVIFARFYLAHIFCNSSKLLYLDNDIVVTDDLTKLYNTPMIAAPFQRSPPQHKPRNTHEPDPRTRDRSANAFKAYPKQHQRGLSTTTSASAVVGFVADKHPFFGGYLRNHLNWSQPVVSSFIDKVDHEVFLNGGVLLMDATAWRAGNWTEAAEQLIQANRNSMIYSSSIGDQAIFYILFQNRMVYLPSHYNMRRLPTRSVNLLEDGVLGEYIYNEKIQLLINYCFSLGIVHFAGAVKSDANRLCEDPLQYPVFLPSVLPLYLSIVNSFQQRCPSSTYRPSAACQKSVKIVQDHFFYKVMKPKYNPGRGKFSWPPHQSHHNRI